MRAKNSLMCRFKYFYLPYKVLSTNPFGPTIYNPPSHKDLPRSTFLCHSGCTHKLFHCLLFEFSVRITLLSVPFFCFKPANINGVGSVKLPRIGEWEECRLFYKPTFHWLSSLLFVSVLSVSWGF